MTMLTSTLSRHGIARPYVTVLVKEEERKRKNNNIKTYASQRCFDRNEDS